MIARVIPLAAGLLFGFGLVLSGMTSPQRVLGFLTLGAHWDPALALVMGGAVAVTLPGFAWMRHRGRTFLGGALVSPGGQVDRRLVLGAGLFGLGWGLAGFCPGPALVASGLGQGAALVFLPAMLLGALAVKR